MLPGTQFGPYRVESLLGAGGMGEVYLATDTRLDRRVAIKILGRELSGQATLRQRLEREAKLISKLNHPNICALYDVGRQDGVDFLVMEYLEGESLAQRLGRGPLPAGQVIDIGIAIANALDRAHKQGIVHRDLKPGNVMLTKSGVKLLDFGLAKLSPAAGIASVSAATFRQELQDPLTQEGAIIGTFQYMSPEQIEGGDADPRSDLFALGTILYEMATGRRAFEATSRAGVIAAILERDPPSMAGDRSSPLERLVRACVAKDPDARIQSAHDAALELEWMRDAAAPAPQQSRVTRTAPPIIAAIAVLAAITALALYFRASHRSAAPFALSIVPPPGQTMIGHAAISPDGTKIAFTAVGADGTQSLWLRRLDDPVAKLLTKMTRIDRAQLFWSPDGKWIAYTDANATMLRVRTEGGEPEKIATTEVTSGAAWNRDGTILFSPRFGSGLQRVAVTGGDPAVVTKLDPRYPEGIHCMPVFLPDGRHFLYLVYTSPRESNRIYARSLDGGDERFVVAADALVGYAKPYLLLARDGALYAQKFDPDALAVLGEPRRVVEGIRYREPDALAFAWVSENGVLAYVPYELSVVRFDVYDRSGSRLKTLWRAGELWRDTSAPGARISPDGRSLLADVSVHVKGAADVFLVDLSRGIATRLTGGRETNRNGVWSPDGQSIAYSSDRDGFYDVYVKAADEGSPARLVSRVGSDEHVADWSPDGKSLLVTIDAPQTKRDIWVVPLDGHGKPWPLVQTEAMEAQPRFSPDGRWVAYASDESGQSEIYVRPFGPGRAVRVSADGGRMPSWSRDGRELLFSTEAGDVMLADVRAGASAVDVGVPRKLFSLPDISEPPQFMPDGTILVGEEESKTSTRIDVTTAWKAKAP